MASKIIVDQLEKTGGSLTALTLPLANATANQILKNDGAGALSWSTPAAAGLSFASQWRLTADFTGDVAPITSSLIKIDTPLGFGQLGADMTLLSGIFTFPDTGYWLIQFKTQFHANVVSMVNAGIIKTTTNNSTYATAAWASVGMSAGNHETGSTAEYIFDVTDTAQCKCRFDIDVDAVGVTTMGNAIQNETCMTFIKLGDT